MSYYSQLVQYAISDGIPRCSLNVAIVVGSLLNVINQGEALIGDGAISWPKMALTFLVPYCVSTYGAVAAKLRHERRHG